MTANHLTHIGLFAFVVAETPTAGLNQIQWSNALSWIEKYSGEHRADKALRILGPTFSGSMPSIIRALSDLRTQTPSFTSVLLYSGRIRGCGPWQWLNRELKASDILPTRTADFVENDAIQINRFYRFLADRGHSLSEVAIISEDETAYGGLPDATPPDAKPDASPPSSVPECEPPMEGTNKPVHLYYPRDISAIRSAYEEQSIFTTVQQPILRKHLAWFSNRNISRRITVRAIRSNHSAGREWRSHRRPSFMALSTHSEPMRYDLSSCVAQIRSTIFS